MSEPLRTETVRATVMETDSKGSPFIPTDSTRAFASLGRLEDPYSDLRRGFFKRIVDRVKPIVPKFEKISEKHGRSMTESATSKRVVWRGPLPGDVFGAKNVKGTSFGENKLERLGPKWRNTRGYGLLDDIDIPRIKRVSEVLRENGLPTERPVAVKKLQEVLVFDKEKKTWKATSIGKWEAKELERIQREDPNFYELAKTYLQETNFVVMEREVQVDERLQDLAIAAKDNHLKETLSPVIKWLNVATQALDRGIIEGTPKPERFEYTKEDLNRYFNNYLPEQMGVYLGRFHKLGLVHGYMHSQNWSAIGTMLDPDSIWGLLIYPDDGIPTADKIEGDIRDSFHGINELAEGLEFSDEFSGTDTKILEVQASYNFAVSYMTERFGGITKDAVKIFQRMWTRLDSTPEVVEMLKAHISV